MAVFKKSKKPQEQIADDGMMSLSGHLKELRNRIVVCILCLVVFLLLGLHFAPRIIDVLTGIGKGYGYEFVYIAPQELLLQYFSVALVAGICLSLPVILYEVWAFIQPGLQKNENRLFLGAMLTGLFFFVLGVLFALRIMLPFMLNFLIGLSKGSNITAAVSVGNYISFLLTIFLVMGLVFELPVVAVVLTQLGLVKVEWMAKARKFVIVAIFFIAAVITPPDVVSQVMVAFPMIGLYELSIVLCRFLQKKRHTEN
ncbi:MAG: twin-arginine translocase subunit TatC [Blautia sp.]|nr:twin-arginine translocase subunit TatC [Blautia sp.]